MDVQTEAHPNNFIELASDIVSAYVSNNNVPVAGLSALISSVHAALAGLGSSAVVGPGDLEKPTPTQIRKSVTTDALISFEDGKLYKTLKRHLTLRGLSPEAYRAKWGLPADYPMTAAGYSAKRSALAHSLGLGRQRRKGAPGSDTVAVPEPINDTGSASAKPRGRPRKAKETV